MLPLNGFPMNRLPMYQYPFLYTNPQNPMEPFSYGPRWMTNTCRKCRAEYPDFESHTCLIDNLLKPKPILYTDTTLL